MAHVYFKTEKSNAHGFELHRPSIKGTKLMFKAIKANKKKIIEKLYHQGSVST